MSSDSVIRRLDGANMDMDMDNDLATSVGGHRIRVGSLSEERSREHKCAPLCCYERFNLPLLLRCRVL